MNKTLSYRAEEPVSTLIQQQPQTFSLTRLWDYFRYMLTTDRNIRWLICMAFIIPVITTLVYCLDSLDSIPSREDSYDYYHFRYWFNDFFKSLWLIMLFVCPAVFGSMAFNSLDTKELRIRNLTLPASNLEKFIVPVITYLLTGVIVAVCSVWLADIIGVCFINIFSDYDRLSVATLNDIFRKISDLESYKREFIISSIIFLNAIFTLGSILFHKFSVIKTSVAISIIAQIGFFIAYATCIISHPNGFRVISENDLSDETMMTFIAAAEAVISIFLYWLTYLRLKEQEFISRW